MDRQFVIYAVIVRRNRRRRAVERNGWGSIVDIDIDSFTLNVVAEDGGNLEDILAFGDGRFGRTGGG